MPRFPMGNRRTGRPAGKTAALCFGLILLPPVTPTATVTLASHLPGEAAPDPAALRDERAGAMVRSMLDWLVGEFGFRAPRAAPTIRFVRPVGLAQLRHRGVPGDRVPGFPAVPDILAIYADRENTIWLRDDWTGATPADQSIIIHELVHHLQNLAGRRFDCAEGREADAFAAQEAWLQRHGGSLEQDFGIDALTLWARTTCLY